MHNVELLRKVREVITEHPERHQQSTWYDSVFGTDLGVAWVADGVTVDDQREWALRPIPDEPNDETGVCGTIACVAGWAAILHAPKGSKLSPTGAGIELPDGRYENILFYAVAALGITATQADYLFSGARDRDEVLAELDYLIEHSDDESDPGDRAA